MQDFSLLARVETILFLLVIAGLSAIGLKKFKIPYTIGLVPVGIAVALLLKFLPQAAPYRNIQLNQELIMYVLLPALIFDASINIDAKLLRKNLFPTLMLAAPGLVIATVITGLAMHMFTSLSLAGAMLFGALISATDPVAVISLFELVGAPRKLRILVDGESLFNDATAIAMFNLVLKMILAGTALSWASLTSGAVDFCSTFLVGLAVGAVLGLIAVKIMSWAENDPHIEIALTILLAYGSFLIADRVFHASGVMSSLGAGVVTSYYGQTRQTGRGREYMRDFWAFMSFLANSAIFLLLGFTEENILFSFSTPGIGKMILVAILAILAARLVVVFGICPFLGRGEKKISRPYMTVMFWGGLRGAVPLALVFSLPATLGERAQIMQITLAVVLFTLLVQGLSTRWLLRFFQLDRPSRLVHLADQIAMFCARRSGLDALRSIAAAKPLAGKPLREITAEYEEKVKNVRSEIDRAFHDSPEDRLAIARMVWARAVDAERRTLSRCYENQLIDEKTYRILSQYNRDLTGDPDSFQIPTPATDQSLLSRKWRNRRLKIAEKPFFRKWFPNYTGQVLQEGFSALLALALGAAEAEKAAFLKTVEELDSNAAIDECAAFFRNRKEILLTYLPKFDKFDAELMDSVRRKCLRQIVYSSERAELEALGKSGAIGESDVEQLLDYVQGKAASL